MSGKSTPRPSASTKMIAATNLNWDLAWEARSFPASVTASAAACVLANSTSARQRVGNGNELRRSLAHERHFSVEVSHHGLQMRPALYVALIALSPLTLLLDRIIPAKRFAWTPQGASR